MKGRHEIKHAINLTDYYVLRQRLGVMLKPDEHAGKDGVYHIRSLYFDTPEDTALREKLDGVRDRDKFRIRYYDEDTSFIQLEKKSKRGGLCIKTSVRLTKEEAQAIVDGDIKWMKNRREPLLKELYGHMLKDRLMPRTIVDYDRNPYVYAPGNVRVTLDHHIRTGLNCTDFLNPAAITIPACEDVIILEVKWDAFLPDLVKTAVQLNSRMASAFSKYAVCRAYM